MIGKGLILLCNKKGITQPINGSWLQALAKHYDIEVTSNGSWIQAIAEEEFGITEMSNGSWVKPIVNSFSGDSQTRINGDWYYTWYLLDESPLPPPSCTTPVQSLTETIGTATSTTSILPAYGLYNYSWGAMIWTAAEMDGGKQITGIEFDYLGWTTPYTFNNQHIYLAHVVEDIFPNNPKVDLSDLTISDLTEVKGLFTNTITSSGYKKFDFDENFCYDGTSNLILVWENRDGTWQSGFGSVRSNTATNKVAYKFVDGNYPSGSGTRASSRPVIKINY